MASRESFISFPVILFLYDFIFISKYRGRNVLEHYKAYIPVLLPLFYYCFLILSFRYSKSGLGINIHSPFEYLLTQFNVHWTYMRLLLLPINQNLIYDYPVAKTLFEFPTLISFICYIGLWGTAIYLFKRSPVISFSLAWFFITLLPVASIIPLYNLITEHRLYLPSIGFFVAVTFALSFLLGKLDARTKTFIPIAGILIISLYAYATYTRNNVWQDKISMWEDVVKKSPSKERAYNNLAMAYRTQGLIDKAIEHYKIAIKLNPDYADTYNNLGAAYNTKGLYDEAIQQWKHAIRLKPDFAQAYNNLGIAFNNKGLPDEAIAYYRESLEISPQYAPAHYNLGNAYLSQGHLEEAIHHYRYALDVLSYSNYQVHYQLANAYRSQGVPDLAVRHYLISLQQNPTFAEAHNDLAALYGSQGFIDKALEHIQVAIELNPELPEAHNNMGNAYKAKRLFNKAIDHYEIAVNIKPGYVDPLFNLGTIYMMQGQTEKAIDYFRKTITRTPDHVQAHFNLGIIYFNMGEQNKALSEFEAVLKIKPDDQKSREIVNTIKRSE
jgi:tetratricopeptide (TPR) repeat protein